VVETTDVSKLDALCSELQQTILAKVRPPLASLRAARRLLGGSGPVICRCGGWLGPAARAGWWLLPACR
jgi:hypothetical protein